MTLNQLKAAYEKADTRAGKLTGEYEAKRQKALTDLKERYAPRLEQATQEAHETQKAYMDALVLDSLKTRPDRYSVADVLVKSGGLTQIQVDEAFED